MKAVEPDPANAATFWLGRPDPVDEVGDGRACRLAEWNRNEEPRILAQPEPLALAACSAVHVDRSSVNTRRARSASRQPTTSVSFASSSL